MTVLLLIFALCILPILNLVIGLEFIKYLKTHRIFRTGPQLAGTLALGSIAVGLLSGLGYTTFTLALIVGAAVPVIRMFIYFKNAAECKFAFDNFLSTGLALTMFAPFCILTFAVAISGNL
ncbi:MAG: hypothetical protein SGJ27_20270 [Candidatus Melainabacteria bacterium]|nr:hypothetical protein [Candidatus Melainabacteria bacterium]